RRAPSGSSSAPSTSVQAAACRTSSASAESGSVTSSSSRVRASASGKASRSAAPSWPPAPVIRKPRPAPRESAIPCSRGARDEVRLPYGFREPGGPHQLDEPPALVLESPQRDHLDAVDHASSLFAPFARTKSFTS